MNRNLAIKVALTLALPTLLLSVWIIRLRSENAVLTARLGAGGGARPDDGPAAEGPGLRLQIQREARRLERLRRDLADVTREPAPDPEASIRRLDHEIATTELELISPYGDPGAGGPRNEEYRRQQLHAQGSRQSEVLMHRRNLDERLAELRTRASDPATRAEVDRLTRLAAELDEELTEIGAGVRPRGDAGSDEQTQRRAERVDMERKVSDLRAELEYWSEQKSGAGEVGRQARVQTLQKQIQDQEHALRALEHRIDADPKH